MKQVPFVRDMMNRRPAIVDPEARMGVVAQIFLKKKVPCAAVIDSQHRFHGLVSTHGLMLALVDLVHDEVPQAPVKAYLDPEQPKLTEDTSLMAVAELFVKGGYVNRALPVLRGERFVGIVTRLDVVHAVMDFFAGVKADEQAATLYISALKGTDEKPSF